MKRRSATHASLSALARGAALLAAVSAAAATAGCSQTPVLVPTRSMERPRDVDFICLYHTADDHWRGAPLANCAVDDAGNSVFPNAEYRLHALVTQETRGELAVVDLARSPLDTTTSMIKVDPRLPGFSFLPVGAVPSDVAADPDGEAVFVASGRDRRIDIVPAEMIRGPLDTDIWSGGALPWPKIDLSEDDGIANALAVVRDASLGSKLYVSLPDAKGGPRLAVFDLSKGALAPTRLADLTLGIAPKDHVNTPPPTCQTQSGKPWWSAYDACFPSDPVTPQGAPFQPPSTAYHLAGITIVGGLGTPHPDGTSTPTAALFAADDLAPVIHVFDLATGVELQQITVGTPVTRLAVSEPVPDEINVGNAAAIEVCETLGWLGDGKDHSADSAVIASELADAAGRCRAHRYVYGIDLVDPDEGDGTLLVLDVPVKLIRQDPTDQTVKNTGTPSPIVSEQIDFAGTEMKQPLACDSPAFPPRRVPLGSLGFGPPTAVPVRAITFVKYDPPTTAGRKGVRCIPWARDAQVAGPEFASAVADKTLFAKIDTAGLRADQNSFAAGSAYDPRRPRGVFALAALANGTVAYVDVDDYDRLCRGPTSLGPGATGEITDAVVRRHHPRLQMLYTPDTQSIVNLTLVSNGLSLSMDQSSESGRQNPHLLPFADNVYVQVSADTPFPLQNETWTMTYEGPIPTFVGNAGTLNDKNVTEPDPKDPTKTVPAVELLDPGGHFCTRGVQDTNGTAGGDIVQIVDAVTSDPKLQAGCLAEFGSEYDVPLSRARDLKIDRTFENRVTISDIGTLVTDPATKNVTFQWAAAIDPKTGQASDAENRVKTCFPGLMRYVVRGNSSWVVVGSYSGYLHRIMPTPPTGPTPTPVTEARCTVDPFRSHIYQGRAYEAPHDPTITGLETPMNLAKNGVCDAVDGKSPLFVNPAVEFAIRAGTQPSLRDMQFSFGLRMVVTPLTLSLATLPTSIRPIASWVHGVDQLDWSQVALVDGIDKGLTVFSLFDLTNSKNFP